MRARNVAVKFAGMALALGLLALLGCQKESAGPTTEDFAKEREALKARVAQSQGGAARKPPPAARPATAPAAAPGSTAPSFASVSRDYNYDPTGKRDPFRNFKWERPDRLREHEISGPLEQFDLNQLSLVAVVWKTGSARALVEDPSGESYIIGQGSRIGKNEGTVIAIDDGLVVVKETYVDYLGQETTKDIEMRMRRNEGG